MCGTAVRYYSPECGVAEWAEAVWRSTRRSRVGEARRRHLQKPSGARVYDAILGGKDNFASTGRWPAKRLELIRRRPGRPGSGRGFLARGRRPHGTGRDQPSSWEHRLRPAHRTQTTHQVAQGRVPRRPGGLGRPDAPWLAHSRGAAHRDPPTPGDARWTSAPARPLPGSTTARSSWLEPPRSGCCWWAWCTHRGREDPAALVRELTGTASRRSYLLLSHTSADARPRGPRPGAGPSRQMIGSGRDAQPQGGSRASSTASNGRPRCVPGVSCIPRRTVPGDVGRPALCWSTEGLGKRARKPADRRRRKRCSPYGSPRGPRTESASASKRRSSSARGTVL